MADSNLTTEIHTKRGFTFTVDTADAHLSLKRWTAVVIEHANRAPTIYAGRWERVDGKKRFVYLHQMVCPCPTGMMPDHKDGDTLNNRRDNLRQSTKSLNTANGVAKGGTSKFRGVCWDKRSGSWLARVSRDSAERWSRHFHDEVDAATAYNFKALEIFGEFARFNSA